MNAEKRQSTNLNSIEHLIERIKRGPQDRANFVASHVDKGIAYQIRALRDRQGLSQEELSKMVGMNQNAISRLESPHRGRPTITTLKRLAEAFDVALVVRFEPFSKSLKWASGTPFIESGLSTESLGVPAFAEELKGGIFEQKFDVGLENIKLANAVNHSTQALSGTVIAFEHFAPMGSAAAGTRGMRSTPAVAQAI